MRGRTNCGIRASERIYTKFVTIYYEIYCQILINCNNQVSLNILRPLTKPPRLKPSEFSKEWGIYIAIIRLTTSLRQLDIISSSINLKITTK